MEIQLVLPGESIDRGKVTWISCRGIAGFIRRILEDYKILKIVVSEQEIGFVLQDK